MEAFFHCLQNKGTSHLNFAQTVDLEYFATTSQLCYQQNLSMVELVDII